MIAARGQARSTTSPPGKPRLSRSHIRYNSGYTEDMKTAVSLPDDLFRRAEATSRRLGVSRSEFYGRAIAQFLDSQQSDSITERLNEVYSRKRAKVDAALHRAQIQSLRRDAW